MLNNFWIQSWNYNDSVELKFTGPKIQSGVKGRKFFLILKYILVFYDQGDFSV